MENLKYIVNPNTGEHINIYSINGLEILNKFVNHYKGGAEPNTINYDYNFDDLEAGNATCEDCKSKLFPENRNSFVRRILPFLIDHMKIKDNIHLGRGNLIYDNLPKLNMGEIQEKSGMGPKKIAYDNLTTINVVNSDSWENFIEHTKNELIKENTGRKNKPQIIFDNKSIQVGPKTVNYDIKTLEIPDEWFGYNPKTDQFQLSSEHDDYKNFLENNTDEDKYYEDNYKISKKNCVVANCKEGPCSLKKKKRMLGSAKNVIKNIDDYKKYYCNIRRCLFVVKPQFKKGNKHHLDFENNKFVGLCEECGKKFLYNLSTADKNNCWKSQLICGEAKFYKTVLKYLLDTEKLGAEGDTAYDCLKYLYEKKIEVINYTVATKIEEISEDIKKNIGSAVVAND